MQAPQDVQNWQIGQPATNKAGGKTASILDGEGGPVVFTTNVLRCPFDAVGYNDPDATRVNLCLEADTALADWCRHLDATIIPMVQKRSSALFGKNVPEADLRANYFSPIKENEKYASSLFKNKMNKVGRGAVRIWNKGGMPREAPENWQDLQVQARVVLKSLWIQSRNWGLTFEVADAMICSEAAAAACPFSTE